MLALKNHGLKWITAQGRRCVHWLSLETWAIESNRGGRVTVELVLNEAWLSYPSCIICTRGTRPIGAEASIRWEIVSGRFERIGIAIHSNRPKTIEHFVAILLKREEHHGEKQTFPCPAWPPSVIRQFELEAIALASSFNRLLFFWSRAAVGARACSTPWWLASVPASSCYKYCSGWMPRAILVARRQWMRRLPLPCNKIPVSHKIGFLTYVPVSRRILFQKSSSSRSG
jgi:hypothetical protein